MIGGNFFRGSRRGGECEGEGKGKGGGEMGFVSRGWTARWEGWSIGWFGMV